MSDPLRSYLTEAVDAGRMPGAVWWVGSPGGSSSHGAVGDATRSTIYDLASLTKPLSTAILLLLLEQEQALSLEWEAERLLPELSGSEYATVPLCALATHSAGLPAWSPLYLKARGIESVLREIARQPRESSAAPVYSDLGYLCLGEAVARAGGSPLDRLFAQRIAAPLGLRATGFPTQIDLSAAAPTELGNSYERRLAATDADGFDWREQLIRGEVHDVNAHSLGGVAGHAGLFGTANEVATLALELLHPRRLGLDESSQKKLLTEAIDGSGRTVGFVLASASRAASGLLPPEAPGHVGFTGSSLWLDPGRDAVYVLLTNRVHPTVQDDDFQSLRRGFHQRALEPA